MKTSRVATGEDNGEPCDDGREERGYPVKGSNYAPGAAGPFGRAATLARTGGQSSFPA